MTKKKKLPKNIGGVKIPKKLRKKVSKTIAKIDSPMARELAAAGLVAAGAAMAKAQMARKAKHAEAHRANDNDRAEKASSHTDADVGGHDPRAAGARFAAVAAGLAATALDRWLNKHAERRGCAGTPPEFPGAPPVGTQPH